MRKEEELKAIKRRAVEIAAEKNRVVKSLKDVIMLVDEVERLRKELSFDLTLLKRVLAAIEIDYEGGQIVKAIETRIECIREALGEE